MPLKSLARLFLCSSDKAAQEDSSNCRPTLSRSSSLETLTPAYTRGAHLEKSLTSTFADAAPAAAAAAPKLPARSIPAKPFGRTSVSSELKKVDSTKRLAELRSVMRSAENNVDFYIVPSEDAHNSEYPAASDRRRAFISGFDGSAGIAIIGLDKAALFTDSRYYQQAENQIDENWILMKAGLPGVPSWGQWVTDEAAALASKTGKRVRVGIDPSLIIHIQAVTLGDKIANTSNGAASLVPIRKNLVDIVWGSARPPVPSEPVFILSTKYSGKDYTEKIAELRGELAARGGVGGVSGVGGVVISALDEVAWLFNLRGGDVKYNPIFISFALITQSEAILYIDPSKVASHDVAHYLRAGGVQVRSYSSFIDDVQRRVGAASVGKLLLPIISSWSLVNAIGLDSIVFGASPVEYAKGRKNEVEMEGMRQCHKRDGAAFVRFLAWLEDQLLIQGKSGQIDELDASNKIAEYREELDLTMGLAYDTISSSGPNAAMNHYTPRPGTARPLNVQEIYLVDSGGQYLDGTIDTTRTVHFGEPTPFQREAFTRVLQGHIAVDRAVFPEGTSGFPLDFVARAPLWRAGLDFGHGTGHGIGHFLGVHEGPFGISSGKNQINVPLAVGNCVTNEPGYYVEGEFGIRIENVLIVVPAKTKHNFNGKKFLKFEHATMVPIQKKMIVTSMLSADEVAWLNEYHAEVREKVGPLIAHDPIATAYLERETAPL
ncbi:Creatinase/aminopeptidase [Ramicandelaber brevisporus]|nr:Creatinase/aminopeptidase [Ramicandelaber brevisporus]